MSAVLKVEGLCVARSGFEVVTDVDLVAPAGEVTVLLGANGSGKTTLLEAISGVIEAKSGRISLGGTEIGSLRRSVRAKRGLAHVEQGRAVFADLTTEENIIAAAPRGAFASVIEMFPALERRRNVRAGLLSGGEQQMLVIARAIVTEPEVLLLDEISLGLAPTIIQNLMPVVRELADTGMAVLLVEQFAALALAIGDAGYVLSRGSVVFHGTCEELRAEPELLQGAYLTGGSAKPKDTPANA